MIYYPLETSVAQMRALDHSLGITTTSMRVILSLRLTWNYILEPWQNLLI
jgi:hypothetical protein